MDPGVFCLTPEQKLEKLKHFLQKKGSAVIAFSGGVDSTFLLHVARDVLGDGVIAVTFDSKIHPRREIAQAQKMAAFCKVRHLILKDDSLLSNGDFLSNPSERCYICKKIMMGKLKEKAKELGISAVMDGANADDLNDFRPGMQAAAEVGILSPLKEVGLGKSEIRRLARQEGLPVWDKPSSPCLCSRIPYGQPITLQKLDQIEKGENLLNELGFGEMRLRHHGDLARIEIPAAKMPEILGPDTLNAVTEGLKKLGFNYITLDLEGFRSGSLNEAL